MPKREKELIKYLMILPRKLEVEIHPAEEGGYWAKVKGLPGCVTQGENFFDLVEMINDAVFTYFEVPLKIRRFLGPYIPLVPEKGKGRWEEGTRHQQIEEVVQKIIQGKKSIRFDKIGLP